MCKEPNANNESPPVLETELDKHPDLQEKSHDSDRSKIMQLWMWNKEKKVAEKKVAEKGQGGREKTKTEMFNFQQKNAK